MVVHLSRDQTIQEMNSYTRRKEGLKRIQRTAKKCTRMYKVRAEPLFYWLLNVLNITSAEGSGLKIIFSYARSFHRSPEQSER